jgi:hypothetical protein
MKASLIIARFTIEEMLGLRVSRILFVLAILLPVAAWVFSRFFLLELLKVQLDVMSAGAYLLGIVFILSCVVNLLGRDIGDKVCHFYLSPPITRHAYFLGRFFGVVAVLLSLYLVILLGSGSLLWLNGDLAATTYGVTGKTVFILAWVAWYQSVSLLGVVFFIASWATGMAEILLFSTAAAGVMWLFPPILEVLNSPVMAQEVPTTIATILNTIAWLLPDMTGGKIILAASHGQLLDGLAMLMHALGHLGYALAMLALGLLFFLRRDL